MDGTPQTVREKRKRSLPQVVFVGYFGRAVRKVTHVMCSRGVRLPMVLCDPALNAGREQWT